MAYPPTYVYLLAFVAMLVMATLLAALWALADGLSNLATPGLPVLIMSGHRLDPEALPGDVHGFLAKPFGPEALAAALQHALAHTPVEVPALRAALARALDAAGFAVPEAGGVNEALQKLAQAPLAAVVTDLGLVDGSGREVLRAARARHPRIACLVTSGGLGLDDPARPDMAYLPKPFDAEQVVQALERCLRARDGDTDERSVCT